jgi:coproporphyrinogen III oxidase-like Fe-S oxidoreductase
LNLAELGLLKLIADFECVGKEELHKLARALSDRYDLGGLEEHAIDEILKLLQVKGLVEIKMGCYKPTQKGVNMVRSLAESFLKP